MKPGEIEPPWVWDEELQVRRLPDLVISHIIWTEGPGPTPIAVTPLRIEVPKWAR